MDRSEWLLNDRLKMLRSFDESDESSIYLSDSRCSEADYEDYFSSGSEDNQSLDTQTTGHPEPVIAYYGVYNQEKGEYELVAKEFDPTFRLCEVSSQIIHVVKSKEYDSIYWEINWDPDHLGKELPPEIFNSEESKRYTLPPSKLDPDQAIDDFDRVIWFFAVDQVRKHLFLVYKNYQLVRIIEQTSPEYTTWYLQTPERGSPPVIIGFDNPGGDTVLTRYYEPPNFLEPPYSVADLLVMNQIPVDYQFYPFSKKYSF